MTAPRWLLSVAILATGYAAAGGLFWLLLQVPESSVGALLASVFLAIGIVVAAGATTAAALAAWQGLAWRAAIVSSWRSLPLFVIGLVAFAALCWLTAAGTTWWTSHRGELDALALRYLKTDRTATAHAAVAWLLWLIPWGPGLSLLGGLTAAGCLPISLPARVRAGLGGGLSLLPVATVTIAVAGFTEGIWRLAYWRPAGLPASATEVVFVATKLAMLYGIFIALIAIALAMLARGVTGAAATVAPALERS